MHKKSSISATVEFVDRDAVVGALQRAVRNVARARPEVCQAILFGSFATDRYQVDSDIDLLLVVERCDEPPPLRGVPYLRLLSREIDRPVDVLVWTRDEFERGQRLKNAFLTEVQRHGVVLL